MYTAQFWLQKTDNVLAVIILMCNYKHCRIAIKLMKGKPILKTTVT